MSKEARFISDLADAHRMASAAGEMLGVGRAFLPILRRRLDVSFAQLVVREERRSGFVFIGGSLAKPVAARRLRVEDAPAVGAIMRTRRTRRWTRAELPSEVRARNEGGIAIPLGPATGARPQLLLGECDAAKFADPMMAAFLAHLKVAIANADVYRRALDLSFRDELSGVYNYRFLIEALERETRRAQRFEHVFSIIMLDLDNLKGYNDSFGHLRGSEAIRTVGEILSAGLRRVDLAARYGGDEFAAILPRADKKGALKVCERIRERVRAFKFPGARRAGAITASFGVATFPIDGKSARALLKKADLALYRAKARGRDTVSA
ncbi:MAG: diguanylate cyclase [bacterium]